MTFGEGMTKCRLFLLGFRGSRQFRQHGVEQALQQAVVFYLLVGHAEHGLCTIVGQLLFRAREHRQGRGHRLHQQAVIVNPAEDFPIGIQKVLAHHLAGGHTQFALELLQNMVTKLLRTRHIHPSAIFHNIQIILYIPTMLNYLFLLLAIIAEAAGTTFLKMSEQFTKLIPSIASLVCYVASLYLLSLCLRTIPIGIAYATWSALGIALITVSGIFFFKQTPDLGAIIGLVLIISGVAVLNLFSKMEIH